MMVYLAVPVGVSEKSPIGVFYTYDQAALAAKEAWEASDGYHTFEIHERKVGVSYDTYALCSWRERTTEPFEPEFQPEAEQKRMAP